MQTDTLNSCNVWIKIFSENTSHSSIWETLYFPYDNSRPQVRITHEKIFDLGLYVHSIHHIHQTLHKVIAIFFVHYKILWKRKKILSNIKWKRLSKTSWTRKSPNIIWEESISSRINSKNRSKIMVNKQLIEINSLLNYSSTNYILLERKLFMTQRNTLTHIYIYMCVCVCVHIYSKKGIMMI